MITLSDNNARRTPSFGASGGQDSRAPRAPRAHAQLPREQCPGSPAGSLPPTWRASSATWRALSRSRHRRFANGLLARIVSWQRWGIPAGVGSRGYRVYDKPGWLSAWTLANDAGRLERRRVRIGLARVHERQSDVVLRQGDDRRSDRAAAPSLTPAAMSVSAGPDAPRVLWLHCAPSEAPLHDSCDAVRLSICTDSGGGHCEPQDEELALPLVALLAISRLRGAVAACGGGGSRQRQSAAASTPFKVGVAGPMTGQYATYGPSHKAGAEIAMAELNAAGGVNGGQVSIAIGDDLGDPKEAVLVAQKYIDDTDVVVVDGHQFSGATIAAGAKYESAGLPMISPSATNPDITHAGRLHLAHLHDRRRAGRRAGQLQRQHAGQAEDRHHVRQLRLRPRPRRRLRSRASRPPEAPSSAKSSTPPATPTSRPSSPS